MPDLTRYHRKRDAARTPEPMDEGEAPDAGRALPPGAPRLYVVHQHAARAMHWDLRLELDGVLVSFAVPKGPSLDPTEKRLAVRTEDHPLSYADFEGVIPAGSYGAGATILWDRGCYRTVDGSSPARGLAAGKLDLVLDGRKLRGRWALVHTGARSGADARHWLLLRKGDPPVAGTPELVDAARQSVLSGLTVDELARGVALDDALADAARALGAPERPLEPDALRPMLAETAAQPFTRDGYLFEVKLDGYRLLAVKERGAARARLVTRSGRDVAASYPEIERAVRALPVADAVLDGELVALDARGRSSFGRLQKRAGLASAAPVARACVEIPVTLVAFDLPHAAGFDLRRVPLAQRKGLLAALLASPTALCRYADHVEREGEALFEAVRASGLEGIVAKRAASPYRSGERSADWRKVKVPRTAHLAVVGVVPGRGSRRELGALIVAWRDETGGYVHAGRVGSGLDERTIAALRPRLAELRVERPAFHGAPAPPARGTTYVRPELVCEVRYTEVTDEGLLRQPVFLGLRPDRPPTDCTPRPAPPGDAADAHEPPVDAPSAADEAPVGARRDKVFWPRDGLTKGDLLDYYDAVWPWIAPYLAERPVVLVRYPDGIEGKSFFQHNAPAHTPAWVAREIIDGADLFVANERRALAYLVDSGAIPLHVWSARRGTIDRPDWVLLDLDPKDAPFAAALAVARHLHGLLEALEVPHYVKTSGQSGLHVLVPLGSQLDHDGARTLGEVIARVVCAERPDVATVARLVSQRATKVYVDYLQNGRGKLIVAPFSVRPRPGAPVSMPLDWSRVTKRLDPGRWTMRTAIPWLERHGDPMRALLDGPPADVPRLLDALAARLAGGGAVRRPR